MATNKELVEQAVGAIPKWMAFLNAKEAEQNLILEQMQDEGSEFAPKTFTERLTDRFTTKEDKPEPIGPVNEAIDDSDVTPSQVSLEKEEPVNEEDVEEEEAQGEQESESSEDDNKKEISNEEFKDIF